MAGEGPDGLRESLTRFATGTTETDIVDLIASYYVRSRPRLLHLSMLEGHQQKLLGSGKRSISFINSARDF
jgi:hypothetical protein